MNAMLPPLAFMFAFFAVLMHLAGWGELLILPLAITALLALLGLAFAHPERPASSRIACLMAVALAASPLAVPWVQGIRLRHLENRRDAVTAPMFKAMDAQVQATKPAILAYHQQNGLFPDVYADKMLGYVDRTGALRQPPAGTADLKPPRDPFLSGNSLMRWAAIRDKGVLLVSAGQDGVPEFPLPGVMMDGPPAEPMSDIATLGVDPRWKTYDPTNGAISLGDAVYFAGPISYEEAMKPLFSAWDAAHSSSAWRPTVLKHSADIDSDPQSARDAAGAEVLLSKSEWLAALALASRARGLRDPYQAQWKDADLRVDRTRGLALYQLGAFREAADALIDYVALQPNDALGHFYLGASLFQGGNRDAAMIHLQAAAQISVTDPIEDTAYGIIQQIGRGVAPSFPPAAGVK